MKKILFLVAFLAISSIAFTQEFPEPAVDSSLNELLVKLDSLIGNGTVTVENAKEIIKSLPSIKSKEGQVQWGTLVLWGLGVFIPFLIRKLGLSTVLGGVLSFLNKIKDNKILAAVAAGIVTLIAISQGLGVGDGLSTFVFMVGGTTLTYFGLQLLGWILDKLGIKLPLRTPKPS